MPNAAYLRGQAAEKRQMAEMLQQTGASLSIAADRAMLLQHAQKLVVEAAELEVQAQAIESRG